MSTVSTFTVSTVSTVKEREGKGNILKIRIQAVMYSMETFASVIYYA